MKHSILKLLAAAALLLATAACTTDEPADGNRLPEGQYPLEIAGITLGVEGGEAQPWGAPQTRVSETADGTGSVFDAGDRFAVQIDGEGEVGTYAVQDDNTVRAETPLYWSDRNDHTVRAWYPATDGTLDLGDQSQRLAYLLSGTGTGKYPDPVTLTFTHALAKVRVTPSDEALGEVQSLQLYACTRCAYEKGQAGQGSQEGWIEMKPCEYTENGATITCWEANVVPGYAISKLRANGTEERDLSAAFTPVAGKFYDIPLMKKVQLPPYTYDETTNTYTVNTAEGLAVWAEAARGDLSTNCILGADITLEKPADGSDNWTAVGGNGAPYTGSFDGAGHRISNLKFNVSSNIKGMFGLLDGGARISNLTLQGVDFYGTGNIGGITGWAKDATIVNCTVSGRIASNNSWVGGISGENTSATRICGCQVVDAEISGAGSVGGVVGANSGTAVACCLTGSTINASGVAGGVAGNNSGTLISCSFSGNLFVSGMAYRGAIVGNNSRTVTACYWDTYDGNGLGNGSGQTSKVDGSSITWSTAIGAMNAAIESWNASNPDTPCNYRFTSGSDGHPVIE